MIFFLFSSRCFPENWNWNEFSEKPHFYSPLESIRRWRCVNLKKFACSFLVLKLIRFEEMNVTKFQKEANRIKKESSWPSKISKPSDQGKTQKRNWQIQFEKERKGKERKKKEEKKIFCFWWPSGYSERKRENQATTLWYSNRTNSSLFSCWRTQEETSHLSGQDLWELHILLKTHPPRQLWKQVTVSIRAPHGCQPEGLSLRKNGFLIRGLKPLSTKQVPRKKDSSPTVMISESCMYFFNLRRGRITEESYTKKLLKKQL